MTDFVLFGVKLIYNITQNSFKKLIESTNEIVEEVNLPNESKPIKLENNIFICKNDIQSDANIHSSNDYIDFKLLTLEQQVKIKELYYLNCENVAEYDKAIRNVIELMLFVLKTNCDEYHKLKLLAFCFPDYIWRDEELITLLAKSYKDLSDLTEVRKKILIILNSSANNDTLEELLNTSLVGKEKYINFLHKYLDKYYGLDFLFNF